MRNFIEELQSRDMIHTKVPDIEQQLSQEKTAAYIGFDPTAASLHIGNLAAIMLLKQFEVCGHRPIIVLGGATGMIGDPSFKKSERTFLDHDTLRHNQACIEKQVRAFFDVGARDGALVLNNYDHYKDMNVLTFLREVGKGMSVNYMMAKEGIKSRLETGISYTEFTYPLLQAYDFYYFYKVYGIKMQMGGSDQWGNLTTGIELIRRKLGQRAYALTTPLMVKADGGKFGKTEEGNVWLDAAMTSPYAFYQFLLNTADEDAKVLIKRLTLYPLQEIQEILLAHQREPHKRMLQKALAKFVTTFVHGAPAYEQAAQASDVLFGSASSSGLYSLQGSYLRECLAGIPRVLIHPDAVKRTTDLITFLTQGTDYIIFNSRREAREVVKAGGLRINKQRVVDVAQLHQLQWIDDTYLLVQKGKKKFYLIERMR